MGATTEGTGELVPQHLGWGDQQCIVLNFLTVVFKKQEISQQVWYHNFHLIVFLGSYNNGRNHGRKVEILELI